MSCNREFRICIGVFIACISPALSSSVGFAEVNPTVQVHGVSRQTFEPDTVRVRWRVYAHGVTAGSAVKKLDACRKILEKRLAALKENKPNHQFGPNVEHMEKEPTFQKMQMQILQNFGQGQKKDEDHDKLIRLAFTVTLEWPMSEGQIAEPYRLIDIIRRQLETIKILKSDESEMDDGEDEEMEDEDDFVETKIRVTDGPVFSYVRRLSEKETETSAGLAFQNARRRAEQLAKASGRKLGPLVRISDSAKMTNVFDHMKEASAVMDMFGSENPKFDEDASRPTTELVSEKLKPIPYHVKITVVFSLE